MINDLSHFGSPLLEHIDGSISMCIDDRMGLFQGSHLNIDAVRQSALSVFELSTKSR